MGILLIRFGNSLVFQAVALTCSLLRKAGAKTVVSDGKYSACVTAPAIKRTGALQTREGDPGYIVIFKRAMGVALLVVTQFSIAQNADLSARLSASLVTRYPAGSILTAELADRALTEALAVRVQIDAQFSLVERSCYSISFVSSCLEDAKERRLAVLARVRPVEIEANTFNRRMRVLERDMTLLEKRAALASEAPQRFKDEQLKEVEAVQKLSHAAQKLQAMQDADQVSATDAGKRVEEHAAKFRRTQEKESVNAPRRAANEAAYAQKTKDAEARQREVAVNKMEKGLARTQ